MYEKRPRIKCNVCKVYLNFSAFSKTNHTCLKCWSGLK